ncbi:Suppressor of the cold-sensitive snRNP bioproteinsis mutant brr1-1, partial [Perkinsus chesapeaki]
LFPSTFMRSIPALLLTWYAASQDVYDNRTVLSVFYEGSMIDVRTLPDLLAHAGVERDDRITSFFNNTHIKTLRYAECQIAVTSMDSVSNVDLCDYIHEAKRHLPGLVTTCGKNINGKLTQLDDELYVNDPAARMEAQLVRMRMAEVWETLQKYARTNITVAVIDQGVDFVDPDMKPLMCSLNTSDGRTIKGGWNFVDDCALPTVESGHGQYVSRVLAARGNDSYGMVGVAADHVRLVPLQACRGGDCPIVHLVEAIDLAMDLGVDVISMSLRYFINGYSSGERSLLETVLRKAQEQNIILVSAAGNDKSDATDCYP